ncbi:DUF2922 domain-containing protein [Macrococcus brunensis]|uniref:DUF2922 domain-containing protein n=1 Tax=Macrococcus brunensis TaxID=198483 RepID=A0A4R6BAX7_9STAP|nr:DUF2922 domain-containing protein [Macrococcus brunensis]TDL94110.1 DUF2922 domain-containing protein [Macrococcus brunensis]ULG70926.1 DUF2922 domain-containing protein [Macrococcus brunensis]ULG73262.1 DUF2922 domain-containing protein [Macrococcus brunensis]
MKTLQMTFMTDFGKSYQFSVVNPKADLNAQTVENVMQTIIDKQYFETKAGRPVAIKSAKLVDRIESILIKKD